MATTAKKPPPAPVEEVKETAPVVTPVEVLPVVETTTVTGYAPLSDDQTRRVNTIKEHFEDTVKYLLVLRDSYHDGETQRALSVAITHAETASMWAVRAVTKVA